MLIKRTYRRRTLGFSLIELMVTLTVLGVLMAIAVPSMRTLINAQKVKAAGFDLYSTFLLAQSEAVKRNASVSITPISTNWVNGWSLTTLDPVDSSVTLTLRRQEAVSGVTITDSRGASPTAVTYSHSGRTNVGSGFTLTIEAASDTSVTGRCMAVKSSGTPITSIKPTGGPC